MVSLPISLGALIFMAAVTCSASGQALTTLFSFNSGPNWEVGPGNLVLSGSTLYGTAVYAGDLGQGAAQDAVVEDAGKEAGEDGYDLKAHILR